MKTKLFQRMSTLALSAIMAFSLVACGDKTGGETGGKDPAETVAAATEKLNSAKSFSAEMSTKFTMSLAGESMDMEMHMTADTFTDPMKSKIVMTSTGDGTALPETEMYLQADGDSYSVYVQSGTQWVTQTLTAEDAAQFEPQSSTDQYLSYVKSFTAAGSETVGSVKADRYDGTITGKDIVEVLNSAAAANGSMESVSSIVDSLSDPNAIEKMSGLEMSVWVDPATGYPVRQQLDMGPFMSELMAAIAESSGVSVEEMGVNIDSALVTVDYSNFDAVEDFEIPADAVA